jgi:hypothetical protein
VPAPGPKFPAENTGTIPSATHVRITWLNQVSFASSAVQELLTTAGKSRVEGFPSGSTTHWAAARRLLPRPDPFPPIALATITLAPGATPMGVPLASPPTIVPMVWVPWPLSS